MSAKRKLMVSLFSIIFVVFAVVTTFSVVYALTQQEVETLIDMEYTVEDIDGYVEATYTIGSSTNYLTPVGNRVEDNKLVFKAEDVDNAGHFEFPNESLLLDEVNDTLIIKYAYSNTGDKHYIASMDFESELNPNNMTVEYGIKNSSTGAVNYSTDRYAVVVPADSTNKEYYIKISVDDKANYASFTAKINWILQGCDPQSAEYLTYENLDIQGTDGVYTASYTGGYIHTGELVYPSEINGSPVTAVASSESITSEQKSYVKKVVIPNSVTTIENNAFNGFNHLEEVVFGDVGSSVQIASTSSLKTIGEYAFANCERLDELTLPTGVTTIGKNVFENCYNLKQMTLPTGVTTLTEAMFKNCSSLTSVEIIETIVDFPAEIFSGCTELVNFEIPNNIETVGASAFKNCSRIVGELDLYFATSIGANAFEGCAGLTKITIGENVTTLNNTTFANCENVENYYLLSHEAITTLSDINVFSNINDDCKIYVIESLMSNYSVDTNWSTYADHFDEIGYTTSGDCVDSVEAPVIDLRIYGNSIQNGTPTPDNPVEIESVGEKTNNLLNPNAELVKLKAYLGIDLSGNDKYYTLHIKLRDGKTVPSAYFGFVYYREESSTAASADWLILNGSLNSSYGDGQTYACVSLIPSTYYLTGVCCYSGTQTVWDSIMDVFDVSLVEGSYTIDTMPEFEPYGKYKIPVKVDGVVKNIYLDEPLRKVGDVADYIDLKTGKVVRRVKQEVITHDSSFGKFNGVTNYSAFYMEVYSQISYSQLNKINYPILSNKFVYHAANGGNTNSYWTGAYQISPSLAATYNRIIFSLPNTITSVSEAKSWLADNPVEFSYVLATPTEESIDMPDFSTIEGGTTFEVLTDVPPNQVMVKYHK